METSKLATHLAELQSQAIRFSDKLQELYIPALESRLLEMADVARNNEQQWRLLQVSRELKRQKASLAMSFRIHLVEGFRLFQQGELGGKSSFVDDDLSRDLSLVADDELEQNLAASSLSRRTETRYAEDLYALNQRMALLKGGRKLPEDGNPLGPYRFADALQSEIRGLELDTRLKVMFYRIFENVLLENLGSLYKGANDYLIGEGILPNLRYGAGGAARPASAPPKPAAATSAAPTAGAPEQPERKLTVVPPVSPPVEQAANSAAAQKDLYAAICALQSASQGTPPPGAPSAAPYQPHYFSQPGPAAGAAVALCSPNEVVTALASVPLVQHAEVLEHVAVPPAMTVEQYQGVTRRLREQIGQDKQIGVDDSRIIDLVGMIFEYMLGDKQLPDSVKAVLSYLHTPYLKAAFIDRQVFENPEHPARQLLNGLAEAGTRWVNSDGESQFKVFPKIKSVVRKVLTEFHSDMRLFDEWLHEMAEFNQKVEHSVALMERRAREKAEGEDRLRVVKRRVLHEVRKRMQGVDLHAHVVVLLLHPWSDYLTFILLRHGEDSLQWQEGLDAVDDIVWSVQAKRDTNDRNRLMLIQDALRARVQTGLETIAHDQAKSNRLIDALVQSQMLALQSLIAEPASPQKRAEMEAEASADLADDSVDASAFSAAEREVLDQLGHTDFGSWIEFDDLDSHKNLRARIAWFNSTTSRFMLVDRSGKQVAVKSGIEIARMILASQARMIVSSEKPFFERALEHILVRMKAALPH